MGRMRASGPEQTRDRSAAVLVVDDTADHLELMARRLRDAGYLVRTATSGEDALTQLDGADLVLLDYRLPGISGLETLQRIRQLDGPAVVMVTGMGSEGTAVQAMRAGAIDYVVKEPGYLTAMPQVVERAWRHADLSRRAQEMQRIALLVTSATERAQVLAEIVRGARRLLRASACVLFVAGDRGSALVESDGDSPIPVEALAQEVSTLLAASGGVDTLAHPGRLLLRLPSADGEQLGVLAVLTESDAAFLPEEVRLAETFASFAGIALEKLHRLELERTLMEELQRMLDLRRDVVASVSHELRTPLTCIRGFSETLALRWEAIGDENRRSFVTKIRSHTEELSQLVESLLDFASVEAGRFEAHVRELDLSVEVSTTIADLAPILGSRALVVAIPSVHVLADPALLRRIVSNLVSNAVKYSDAATPITIRALAAGTRTRVEVQDRGIGIEPADASRVFEPFWRAHHVAQQAMRGAGIGLTLVKEYVRVLGGQVGVESEPGVGSTFWFTIRSAPSRAPSRAAVVSQEAR